MLSERAKERVAYWGRKLECPVDENANYENTYVCPLCGSSLIVGLLIFPSGATATSSPFPKTEEHGHGKATQATG
jgi:hypothetical protein